MRWLLCLFGYHRWWLDDLAGAVHKDRYECRDCGKSIPAAVNGVYRTDIREWEDGWYPHDS